MTSTETIVLVAFALTAFACLCEIVLISKRVKL